MVKTPCVITEISLISGICRKIHLYMGEMAKWIDKEWLKRGQIN